MNSEEKLLLKAKEILKTEERLRKEIKELRKEIKNELNGYFLKDKNGYIHFTSGIGCKANYEDEMHNMKVRNLIEICQQGYGSNMTLKKWAKKYVDKYDELCDGLNELRKGE